MEKNCPKPFMTVFPSERSCSTDTKTDQDFENPSRNKEIIADLGSQVNKKWWNISKLVHFPEGGWFNLFWNCAQFLGHISGVALSILDCRVANENY